MKFDENNHQQKENSMLREIRINKYTKQTEIKYNRYIEYIKNVDYPYFIDFPQTSKIDPNILYACIFDAREAYIKGVLRIDTRNFSENKPNIFLFPENVFGTAELQTVVIRNKEYLLGFLDDNGEHTISLIDVKDKKIESIDIPARIPPGFHSTIFKI